MTDNIPMYFLGANAPGGFVSHFADVYDVTEGWRVYIIKGGPGTGKSSLMRRVAEAAADRGEAVWVSPCSSDPDSLDAAVMPNMRVCLMDGTAPHVVEPQYPGMCEVIINLGDHYDIDMLALSADRLYPKCIDNAALHARASRYITAAGQMMADSMKLAAACTDMSGAAAYGAKLARRMLPDKAGRAGREQMRFLSAVTPRGFMFLSGTVTATCPTIKAVEDEYGAVSEAMLSAFRLVALERGYDIINCRSPFMPNGAPEHVLVPEAGVALCTCNRRMPLDVTRLIRSERFTDTEALRRHKQRLSFNRRAVDQLIDAAVDTLAAAKLTHDQMEHFYIEAMDFDAVNRRTDALIQRIFG